MSVWTGGEIGTIFSYPLLCSPYDDDDDDDDDYDDDDEGRRVMKT